MKVYNVTPVEPLWQSCESCQWKLPDTCRSCRMASRERAIELATQFGTASLITQYKKPSLIKRILSKIGCK